MARPYQRYGILQLEELLTSCKDDPKAMGDLKAELEQRSTQKAADLLVQVNKLLGTAEAPVLRSPEFQPGLDLKQTGSLVPDLAVQPPQYPPAAPAAKTPRAASAPEAAGKGAIDNEAEEVRATMGTSDAAKVLGVGVNAQWEAVEKARRELIRSVLAKGDTEADAAAKRVNLAYVSLAASRRF